jgi:hypothetical protein
MSDRENSDARSPVPQTLIGASVYQAGLRQGCLYVVYMLSSRQRMPPSTLHGANFSILETAMNTSGALGS